MSEAEHRADALAVASPFTRGEWAHALDILGPNADAMLPTVHSLCSLGWHGPVSAALALTKALDPTALPRGGDRESVRAHRWAQ